MRKKYNTKNKIANMILDLRKERNLAYENATSGKINEFVRTKFNEMNPVGERMNARQREEYADKVFEILEEVLDVSLTDSWNASPFFRETAEYRNVALGDQVEFTVRDSSWVIVNEFSGNTWTTERQKLGEQRSFTVPTKWFFAHVYDDYERFLTGAITVQELVAAVADAYIRHVDSMVATAFNGADATLPAQFNITGPLDMDDFTELVMRVQVASGQPVRIYGTKMALAQLNNLQEVEYYSDAMKDELYTTGRLGRWMGNNVVEIPQAFNPGTFDWSVENNVLYILPDNERPIKFVDEGETRSRMLDYDQTPDQTIDYQLQRKMGVGVIYGTMFGKYTIT